MGTLTRDAIKQASQPVTFDVSAEGLEGKAKRLRHSQLAEYESWFTDKGGNILQDRFLLRRERLLGMSLVDDAGELLYPGEDYRELAEMDSGLVRQLFDQVEKGCGLREMHEAKSVKN